MHLTNLTRANEIGANCYHLRIGGTGFLLDCGTHPKLEGNASLPRLDLLATLKPDALLLSHAHLDHLGAMPVVMGEFPDLPACMTHPTSVIADRALHNSASVMTKQRAELQLPEYPFFTHGQVDRVAKRFKVAPYSRPFDVGGVDVVFHEAGHVQGAAGIWIESRGESFFYTGDVRFGDMMMTRRAQFPEKRPDVMMIECTRGAAPRGHDWNAEMDRLGRSILETYAKGGSVLIPCFALGKTQEILKVFHDLIQEGALPDQMIYISGLASTYNEIYDDMAGTSPRVCPGFKLKKNLNLEVLETTEALTMKLGRGRLLLVSSGMMTPRTMSHRMAQRMCGEDRHSIFFVGYVDPASPAGKLKAAGTGGRADLGGDFGEADVRCRIESFDFTSHCHREDMMEYVARVRPRRVLLVHGDAAALEWFRGEIGRVMPETKVEIPASGETIEM